VYRKDKGNPGPRRRPRCPGYSSFPSISVISFPVSMNGSSNLRRIPVRRSQLVTHWFTPIRITDVCLMWRTIHSSDQKKSAGHTLVHTEDSRGNCMLVCNRRCVSLTTHCGICWPSAWI
jgi:hypothetical protein